MKRGIQQIDLRQYQDQADDDQAAGQDRQKHRFGIPLRHAMKSRVLRHCKQWHESAKVPWVPVRR